MTGPGFIAVHEMIDPQVDTVRDFVDAIAERMATLGATPPTAWLAHWSHSVPLKTTQLAAHRVPAHLRALNDVYTRVIEAHRKAIAFAGESDPVTEDLLIGQTAELEKFQWFIRAFLENGEGSI